MSERPQQLAPLAVPAEAGTGPRLRVAFWTLGCRLNQYDTEGISAAMARTRPIEVVPWDEAADLYVLNSCTVTSRADQECRRLARQAKRRHPGGKVVVAGCYAQTQPDELAAIPEIDGVVGNADKDDVGRWLPRVLAADERTMAVGGFAEDAVFDSPLIDAVSGRSRAFVKIQDGCNLRCTYCLIWRARGPGRSRAPTDVLAQLRLLRGTRLPGSDPGGHPPGGLRPRPAAAGAADRAARTLPGRVPGPAPAPVEHPSQRGDARSCWTSSPRHPRLRPHLHISLQSGSSSVLRRMKRPYRGERAWEALRAAAAAVPGIGIGADLIVGFPGETDEEFAETRRMVQELPFSYLHVFRFSPRPGTAAAALPDQVHAETVSRRSAVLRALADAKQAAFADALTGSVREAVVEAEGAVPGWRQATTDNYVGVMVPANAAADLPPGTLVEVTVGARRDGRLWAAGVRAKENSRMATFQDGLPDLTAAAPATAAGRRVYIETYGCQMNVYDSQAIGGLLGRDGFAAAGSADDADVVLLNTCSVRDHAEHKILSRVGEIRAARRSRGLDDPLIGICGCMAERLGDQLRKGGQAVDLVVGVDNYDTLPALLRELTGDGAPAVRTVTGHRGDQHYVAPPELYPVNNSHLVTIHKGCDYKCTYCIVPMTRGPQSEKHPDTIVAEIGGIVAAGGREVTLLGQNVTAYRWGRDLDFAALLAVVADIDGLERIRFLTGHPRDMHRHTMEAIGRLDKVCPWLHVPAQSGSDRVLRRMKRLYTRAEYQAMVDTARDLIPDVTFSSDFIVGFPGETPEDFQQTLEVVRYVKYDQIFSFKYSERPGVPAARLPDDVPMAEKKRRLAELMAVQEEVWAGAAAGSVGAVWRGIVEGEARRPAGAVRVRTANNRKVVIEGAGLAIGQQVGVRVTGFRNTTFTGELLA